MLKSPTDPRWLPCALVRLDALLADHAHCEKKAAATALSLVGAYPDRERLVRHLSALAIEELRHFRAVHERLRARGLGLTRDAGDPYAKQLMQLVRSGGDARLMDRLLVGGLIEARSHERLTLLAEGIAEPGLAGFYASLARAEHGHKRGTTPPPNFKSGKARLETPAGTFDCSHIQFGGDGGTTHVWRSDKVPVTGLVKTVTNHQTVELVAMGHDATSAITQEPVELPKLIRDGMNKKKKKKKKAK